MTLVTRVNPEYPKVAKDARVQGTVRFTAQLNKDGNVKTLELISGHPLLVQAAMEAAKQWVYKPTLLNGEPVEVRTPIEINFSLDPPAALQPGAGSSTPQSTEGAYRIGGGVSAPRVISKKEPEYSEEARSARLDGMVTLSLVVGEDGAPRNIRTAKALGFGLDEKAVEAVSTWRFAPGQKEGSPVPVMATIQVNFRLLCPPGHWHLVGATFKPPGGVSLPSVVKSGFPPDAPAQAAGSVILTFDVDEHGSPINMHVEKSSDADSERDVIAAARKWRFNPGLKDGTPVVVPLTLEFSQVANVGVSSSPTPAKAQ